MVEIWCIGLREKLSREWKPEEFQRRLVATWYENGGLVIRQAAVRDFHLDGWA